MHTRRARVLIAEDSPRALSPAIESALARHEVEVAVGASDAVRRIDRAPRPYDVIFHDLAACDGLPALELWVYLALSHSAAAKRMVFVASARLPWRTRAFLDHLPNPCVDLPADAEALDALVSRRAGAACG